LERGDHLAESDKLELHVAVGFLLVRDVGQDGEAVIALDSVRYLVADEAHRWGIVNLAETARSSAR